MNEPILVVDDEVDICRVLSLILSAEGYRVDTAHDVATALEKGSATDYALALVDLRLGKESGFEVLRALVQERPQTPVAMITAHGSVESAVEAVKAGAADYITKPFNNDDVTLRVGRIIETTRLKKTAEELERTLYSRYDQRAFVGESSAITETLAVVERVAPTRSNLILMGETGVGKGFLARIIHYNSPRRKEPFVEVNCGAIPEGLLETQFFGHVKGAFTGADQNHDGFFVRANGGTIFLDEVGELPPALQVKLLTALQERTVTPVGGASPIPIDVRIVAASDKDLAEAVKRGAFREDLYYRLNVIEIVIPPLRARPEDILPLARHFLERYAEEMGKPLTRFDRRVEELFLAYPWPGNIRELENAVERGVAVSDGPVITEFDLPGRMVAGDAASTDHDLKNRVAEFEKQVIHEAVVRHGGDKNAAAEELHINLATLYRKLGKP